MNCLEYICVNSFQVRKEDRFVDDDYEFSLRQKTVSNYGYGIAVTTLQLAHAYSILADGGLRLPITFLKLDTAPAGQQVIPKKVAREVDVMLQDVVTNGTGKLAQVPGYSVAGKTGTSYVATAQGYDKTRYNSDFVGFAPASNPQLVIALMIRDPQEKHFGAEVAAPVFSKVMAGALRILNISPDALKTT